jgi:hypothetical protein
MRLSKLRKHDFKFYALFTAFSTLAGIYSVYLLKINYGAMAFADFALSTVNIQIIVALSDLGIKYSFFKPNAKFSNRHDFRYLIVLKLVIALSLYVISLVFYRSSVYLMHLPMLIGFSVFPALLLQRFKLYTIISLNNFVFRVLPLLGLAFLDQIEGFVLLSGILLLINGLLANNALGAFKLRGFKWTYFIRVASNVLKDNRFLSALSVMNIFEVYIHVFLAKVFLTKELFADFMYVERYTNYMKQVVVYLYEFLYPKVNVYNVRLYQRYARLGAVAMTLFVCIFILLEKQFNWVFKEWSNYGLLAAMALFPVLIMLFNFIQSLIYFKYCNDKRGFKIVLQAFGIKILVFFMLSPLIGVLAIPFSLIASEVFMGLKRALAANKELGLRVRLL